MNVLLITLNYSHNTGDLLIAESISSSAHKQNSWRIHRLPLLYYNGMVGNKWLNAFRGVSRVWRAVQKSDVIVIAGGNLVIPKVIRFAFSFLLYAGTAKLLSRPLYVAFMGASNRPHWLGTIFYKLSLKSAVHIWARDKHSALVMQEITNRNDISIVPDGAFFNRYKCNRRSEKTSAKLSVGVVPYEYRDLFWNERLTGISQCHYAQQYNEMIENLIDNGYEVKIVVTAEEDRLFGESLSKKYGLQLYQPSTDEELLDTMCMQVDLVVSTRMHGLISALLCEKSIVAVGGQHKIFSLIEQIESDPKTFVVDINLNMASNILGRLEDKKLICLSKTRRDELVERLEKVWSQIGANTDRQHL